MSDPDAGPTPEGTPESSGHVLTPIGVFHGDRRYPYEAPRQGSLHPEDTDSGPGRIELLPRSNFEQALGDLRGFDRVWLIFGFHKAPRVRPGDGWKPLVHPPRGSDRKLGVFATRSPHRPGGLGLSAVRLVSIDRLTLRVDETDLLDGSPIFDIKPYVPRYDAFPDARAGWTETEPAARFSVDFTDRARARMDFLQNAGGPDLAAFCRLQLEHDPTDGKRKRVRPGSNPETFTLAYRTWRVTFTVNPDASAVFVHDIDSGYESFDLAPGAADPYGDLDLHRAFRERFEA